MAETRSSRPVPLPRTPAGGSAAGPQVSPGSDPDARPGTGRGSGSRRAAPGRARRALRRTAIGAGILLGTLGLLGLAGDLWVRHRLAANLPQTAGRLAVAGLSAPATIERDAQGVPNIRGASRRDVAFATGFAHAQDRFFQMDLLRRRSAGELAELFGPPALQLDRTMRIHLFREHARRVLAASAPDLRDLLAAYADGVNAGLGTLAAPPFEYLVLRSEPRAWRPEDSVLVLFSMFTQLEDVNAATESAVTLMHDQMPEGLFQFLNPPATEWDAPIAGTPPPAPPPPGPAVFDLRRGRQASHAPRGEGTGQRAGDVADHESSPLRHGATRIAGSGWAVTGPAASSSRAGARPVAGDGRAQAGPAASNSWAVAGRLAAGGGALLANELHLGLAVPNVWYRAALSWPAEAAGQPPQRVVGATLPGAPALVVGSNGQVAWGLTNSVLDTSDLVLLDPAPGDPDRYLTPEGPKAFQHHHEVLKVRGGPDEKLAVDWTIWGPVLDKDWRGRRRAVRAVVDEPGAADFEILRLETASSLDQALDIAARSGVPALNFLAADRAGRIGWTIAGRLPRRAGFDGETASSWADGAHRWLGLVPPGAVPRLADPAAGRLWTANNRVLAGAAAAPLGRGNFVLGARARQIRDDLLALPLASVEDMRRIQLDDRALFLRRWHDLLLQVLSPQAVAADPRRRELRALVEGWGGRATVGSAGYRMVRTFRSMVRRAVFAPLTAACRKIDPELSYVDQVNQHEGPLWQLVSSQPLHLLDPRYKSWDELLLAAADAVVAVNAEQGPRLADRTWGERNTMEIEHPLSEALPIVGRRLSMPPRQLPGDDDMPRVQHPDYGATLRMVVSPGREAEGIFQMPGGESGNPLSTHYGDLYDSWAAGAAAPLLPGKPAAVLELVPRAGTGAGTPSLPARNPAAPPRAGTGAR
jgi:penicillin amidase